MPEINPKWNLEGCRLFRKFMDHYLAHGNAAGKNCKDIGVTLTYGPDSEGIKVKFVHKNGKWYTMLVAWDQFEDFSNEKAVKEYFDEVVAIGVIAVVSQGGLGGDTGSAPRAKGIFDTKKPESKIN